MKSELVLCPDYSKKKNHFSFVTQHGRRDMSHEEEVSRAESLYIMASC
jgi:hypothetical protein